MAVIHEVVGTSGSAADGCESRDVVTVWHSLGFASVVKRENVSLPAVKTCDEQFKACAVVVNLGLQLHEVRQEGVGLFTVESGYVPPDRSQVESFSIFYPLLSYGRLDGFLNLLDRGRAFCWQPLLNVVNDVEYRSEVISCEEHPPVLVDLAHFGDVQLTFHPAHTDHLVSDKNQGFAFGCWSCSASGHVRGLSAIGQATIVTTATNMRTDANVRGSEFIHARLHPCHTQSAQRA